MELLSNAPVGTVGTVFNTEGYGQFILEIKGTCTVAWDVSNANRVQTLDAFGETIPPANFIPSTPDFTLAKTVSNDGLFTLVSKARWTRLRVTSGTCTYARMQLIESGGVEVDLEARLREGLVTLALHGQ